MTQKTTQKTRALLNKLHNLKVSQLQHCNQYLITNDDFNVFQSYSSIIAIYNKKEKILILGRDWDYSNTTLKHLYLFLDGYAYVSDLYLYGSKNKKKTIKQFIKDNKIIYDASLF